MRSLTATAIVLGLLAFVSSAAAQTATTTVRKVEPKRAWDVVPLGDCATPQLPSTIAVPWTARPGDRLAWCVDPPATTAQATASDYPLFIDGEALGPVSKACLSAAAGQPVQCFAQLPQAAIDKLRTMGPHRLELARLYQGTQSPLSAPVNITTPGCRVVDMNQAPPVLLDQVAPIFGFPAPPLEDPTPSEVSELESILRTGQIAKRTSFNTPNAATAIGMLRLAGWRVEWWRTQFEAPVPATSSAGGHWYFLAWCAGEPQ